MARFNSKFSKRKKITVNIINQEFLPTRTDFTNNRVEVDLKKATPKNVIFFDKKVIHSITNNNLKFTNFISDIKQQDKITAISNFAKDISIIKDNTDSVTSLSYDKRMLSVISLILDNKTDGIAPQLVKSDVRGTLNLQDGLRVYWYYDLTDDVIKIVCIDPQHLVLPSTHDGKPKDVVMLDTYNQTVNSKNHCISRYFQPHS